MDQKNDKTTAVAEIGADLKLKKEILLDKVQMHVETLRENLVEQLETQLAAMVENCKNDLENLKTSTVIDNKSSSKNRREGGVLKDKEFIARNSMLTDLLEINHFRTIHQIFIAILILLFTNSLLSEINETGRINLSFDLIIWSFGKINIVLTLWLCMFLSTIILFYNGFLFWAKNRNIAPSKVWDYFWLTSYICYICAFFYYPTKSLVSYKLPPASAVVVLCEQIRLIMKSHAFLRSNAGKIIIQSADKENNLKSPDFSTFLYFLFVPTLIYRDSYPRNSKIRWGFVVSNMLQVFGCIFYIYFLLMRHLAGFEEFGKEPLNLKKYILAMFSSMLPSAVIFVCTFFGLLHSWFNAFAEMLRFSDRQFYTDWWNAASYSTYFRTWNIVVHDWLFTYIYKDMYLISSSSNRVIPTLVVFTVSALVHEYIVSFALGYFFPIMYLLFAGFGVAFMFVPKVGNTRQWNIFFWLSLIMGNGIMLSFYRMEWFARQNCPPYSETFNDLLVPRMWMCYRS